MIRRVLLAFLVLAGRTASAFAAEPSANGAAETARPDPAAFRQFVEAHCLECHDRANKTAGLSLDELLASGIAENPQPWEHVVRKLAARQMPPKDTPRPEEPAYNAALAWLTSRLDERAVRKPNPGRTETFRRLNRTEYQNTVRDLLALDIDVESMLPPEESSHGFDNITVADLSPTLLNRYIAAAQKISRLAVGRAPRAPREETFRVRPDITQDTHIEGLPLGTRGGIAIPFNFPRDGEYQIQVWLMRDRNEQIESLGSEPHELEVLMDRSRLERFSIKAPPKGVGDSTVDANLKARVKATAGLHHVGVAFQKKPSSLLETARQPLNVHYNFYRHPRLGPAVYQVSITGPFDAGSQGNTPSRKRLFVCTPTSPENEDGCAQQILSELVRRAYRRPITDDDLRSPLEFFRQGRAEGDFEAGIELALSSVLVQPQFLFRIERDPPAATPGTVYQLTPTELASRLSYFLWSSMPDDELLDLAARGELTRPEVLEKQVRRMLADRRSQSLVDNFADQWLYLRNLDSIVPDMRLFPDFDDNLRQSLRRETELFFESVLREDRSVLDLIRANDTFLNERLARHYGIPHVYGSQFRRVSLDKASHRGGLLRHGSILMVTSYATRTSPVLRGHWVLKNLLGTPPPPPPPNVPALADNTVSSELPVRERLKQHRADPACASCHEQMDPVGFALDNFDAVGRWRGTEAGQAIDAAGNLPDGSQFVGVSGLEDALLARPELFLRTLTEKLMSFALGRGIEHYDAPAIRQVITSARDENYRFSRLILGIVQSTQFQMRTTQ